jgi:hypothetical protein
MVHKDIKPFTVLTVTKRDGWFARACTQVAKQSLRPEKWVVVPEEPMTDIHDVSMPCPVEFWPAPMKIRLSNLNASLNEGLRHVTTPYVIFYQDLIDMPQRCFFRLMQHVDGRTFVTTVTKNDDQTTEEDPRFTGLRKPRLCHPEEWEANVAAAPMDVLRALGGFDEEYDNGWSWDNVNIAERAQMLGCRFICDESNRPQLLYHPKERSMPLNARFHDLAMSQTRTGRRPLRLPYLD